MADEIIYRIEVDDKGTPKIVKFGNASEKAGKKAKDSFGGASKALKDFADEVPGVSGALGMFSKGPAAAAGVAVGALAVGFGAMVKKSIDFADGMNDLSLRLGISTERLSVLSLYAEQSGTDIETLATAMGKLGVKLSEGDKTLLGYGITATSVDEALFQLADKIAGTTDPMLRLKMATDAFGKSGQQMLPLLVQGGAALKEMSDSAPKVSSSMAKMADELNDKFSAMQGKFSGIALGIAEKVIPEIDKWLDGVDRIRKALGLLSADEDYENKRLQARNKIIAQYGDLLEKRKAGEKLIGPVKGAVTIGGLTLRESLAAFDRNNPLERPGSAVPPIPATGVIGAGSGAATGRATSVDYGEQNAIDYYAGLPISDKAKASLEKQYDAEVDLEDAAMEERRQKWNASQEKRFQDQKDAEEKMLAEQSEQWNRMASSVSGAFSSAFADIYNNGRNVFGALASSFGELFVNRAINALADLATNALLGALLGGPGTGAASLVGGFFARGGEPPVGGLSVVNERRQEAIIPRGPVRVEPTAASGNTYVFQVQNPAQAATLQRSIEREKRQGKRGIR